jgi:alkylation response protein AidB-like acyl-CoA dehydrogenase
MLLDLRMLCGLSRELSEQINPEIAIIIHMATSLTKQLENLTEQIAHLAPEIDAQQNWPEAALQALTSAGAWAWVVPSEYGGDPLSDVDRLRAYEAIARGSVALALIVTQRDGAVMHVAAGDNAELKQQLLPDYAANRRFTSVGISQLTTSHGTGGNPHMRATPADDGGYLLDGVMPWVTGAEYCHDLVTGGELNDGRQILAHVSTYQPGIQIEASMKLLALTSTCTARVNCDQVHIPPEHVLVQPTEAAVRPNAPVKPLIVAQRGDWLGRCHRQRTGDSAATLIS